MNRQEALEYLLGVSARCAAIILVALTTLLCVVLVTAGFNFLIIPMWVEIYNKLSNVDGWTLTKEIISIVMFGILATVLAQKYKKKRAEKKTEP